MPLSSTADCPGRQDLALSSWLGRDRDPRRGRSVLSVALLTGPTSALLVLLPLSPAPPLDTKPSPTHSCGVLSDQPDSCFLSDFATLPFPCPCADLSYNWASIVPLFLLLSSHPHCLRGLAKAMAWSAEA